MRRDIEANEWEELMKDKNIEEAWNCFRRKMDEIVDQHVPRFVNTRKKRPDWITKDIARQRRMKKRLWRVCARLGGEDSMRRYKEQKKVAKAIRNAKRKMEKRIATDKDDKNGRKF